MALENTTYFKVRRKLKQAWFFYAVFGALTLGGAIAFFFNHTAGWVFGGCFGGIILLMLLDHLSPGSYYLISEYGILAKRMFSKHLFLWEGIKSIAKINYQKAAVLANQAQMAETGAIGEMDIAQSIQARKQLGKLLLYCTVPFVFSEYSAGHETAVSKTKAATQGEFIHLVNQAGASYLLSPEDCDRFMEQVKV
ncbi:hypothetical protein KAR34_06260 [bacterium]|nr:hypothetical protein [bacterium]